MANENNNVKVEYINFDEKELEEMEKQEEQNKKEEIDEFDRLVEEMEKQEEQNKKEEMEKFDRLVEEMIEEHEKKMEEMGKLADKYHEEMLYDMEPRKDISVKLYPNTHKKLKMMAASEDVALNRLVTSIVEDTLDDFDIVSHVVEGFNVADPVMIYHDEQSKDIHKMFYDLAVNKKLIKGRRKRINVKVNYPTYRVLGVMSAVQDRTLDNIVAEILENETGETIVWEEIKKEIEKNKNS